jgi:hypothetical protein
MYTHIQKIGKPYKKHLLEQEHSKGINRIANNRATVTYARGGRTLVLAIITLFSNCTISIISISNKPCQCRNTGYWVDDTSRD